jgi:hypothetical protein
MAATFRDVDPRTLHVPLIQVEVIGKLNAPVGSLPTIGDVLP